MDAIHDNDPVSNRRPQSCWKQDCGSECFVTFNIFAELIEMMVSSNWIVMYTDKVMLLFPGYRQWANWLATGANSVLCLYFVIAFILGRPHPQRDGTWCDGKPVHMNPSQCEGENTEFSPRNTGHFPRSMKADTNLFHLNLMLSCCDLWPHWRHSAVTDCSVWLKHLHVWCTSILSSICSSDGHQQVGPPVWTRSYSLFLPVNHNIFAAAVACWALGPWFLESLWRQLWL